MVLQAHPPQFPAARPESRIVEESPFRILQVLSRRAGGNLFGQTGFSLRPIKEKRELGTEEDQDDGNVGSDDDNDDE